MSTQTVWVLLETTHEYDNLWSIHATEESAKREADLAVRESGLEWNGDWRQDSDHAGEVRTTKVKKLPRGVDYRSFEVDVRPVHP